jgi:hypothetical protein
MPTLRMNDIDRPLAREQDLQGEIAGILGLAR